jgi:hypothetical protein
MSKPVADRIEGAAQGAPLGLARLGRPGGWRCRSAAGPPWRSRPRPLRPVLTCTARLAALAAARWPAKVSRIARARSASAAPRRARQRLQAERSCSSAVILDLPGIAAAPQEKNKGTAQALAGFMHSAQAA